jgi:hypothetical protein
MSLKKLNLTRLKVNQELKDLACIHPNYTYKILLNNFEFRKNLSDYILKAIPNQYLLIESPEEFYELKKIIRCNAQERERIHELINKRFNELRNQEQTLNV